MAPTSTNGKICYLEIPAIDIQRSADFYYARRTVDAIVKHGGKIVQPIGADAPETTARFTDPSGNVLGIYQEPQRS